MAQTNTVSTLDGLFKSVYGEGPINLVPEVAYLQKRVQFKEADRIGKSYEFPVVLSQEQGVTYIAAGGGSTTLESSVAATLKNAEVDAQQIIVRGQMDYEAAAKAQNSKSAFKNSSELLVENLMDTAGKRLEIAFLHGRSATGLGQCDSSTNSSATVTVLQVNDATWAPGVWSGLEGAKINAYNVSDNSLVSSSTNAIFEITAVDFVNKRLTVTGTATGITALDAACASTGSVYLHFKDARVREPIGLDKIITNSGSLFGIDASAYALWAGSSYAVGGSLTVAKIMQAVALAVGKGGLMEEADLLVPTRAFSALASSLTDLRRDSADSKEGIAGFESIRIHGPNGKLNVVAHPMMKEGEAFLVPFKRVKRIGSQEASFQTPGRRDEIFLHVPDSNAYELRLYMAQAIVVEKPSQCVKLTGITYS